MYNSVRTLERAFRSVVEQTHPDVELIMVDDNSTDDTKKLALSLIQNYKKSQVGKQRTFQLISNLKNFGTYVSRNFAILNAKGSYIGICDSDDTLEPSFISSMLPHLDKYKLVYCKTQNRARKGGSTVIGAASSFFKKELVNELGFFDSVRFAADTEFRLRCSTVFGAGSIFILNKVLYNTNYTKGSLTDREDVGFYSKARQDYVRFFRKFQRNNKQKLTKSFPFPMKRRPFSVPKKSQVGSIDLKKDFVLSYTSKEDRVVEPEHNKKETTKSGMIISANMATIPPRVEIAEKAVASIIDQVDVVRIYLNNFKEVPSFIKNNPKIEYVFKGRDLNASGKHYWGMNPNEYYFSIDDDIVYPPTYVRDHLNFLSRFGDRAIVSLHGNILPWRPFSKMWSHSRYIRYTCLSDLEYNYQTNLGGQGVSVRNTNIVKIDVEKFKFYNMDDIEVSIQALEQEIPIIARKHIGGGKYLGYNKPPVPTLYEQHKDNDSEQVSRTNEIDWRFPAITTSGGKISVLMSAWKCKEYVEEAIYSVLDQKLPRNMSLELIVGVDACEETYEVVKKIKDSRVGIVRMRENVGTYNVFNTMLSKASGDFICRFDSDDIMGVDFLSQSVSHLILNPNLSAIQSRLVYFDKDMKTAYKPSWLRQPLKFRGAGQVIWRTRDLRGKLGAYLPWSCAADTEILSRAKFLGLKVGEPELAYFCYRKHPNALTVKKDTRPRSGVRAKNLSIINSNEALYKKGMTPKKAALNVHSHTIDGLLFNKNHPLVVHTFPFSVISKVNLARKKAEQFMSKNYK